MLNILFNCHKLYIFSPSGAIRTSFGQMLSPMKGFPEQSKWTLCGSLYPTLWNAPQGTSVEINLCGPVIILRLAIPGEDQPKVCVPRHFGLQGASCEWAKKMLPYTLTPSTGVTMAPAVEHWLSLKQDHISLQSFCAEIK